ncbi:hypothetical protein A3709_17335 [Halioglobus sp. HI00S01]|uniref:PepSY domain-containing protein n=1 Tax=Halioglobus sp. HI00S01 TaxID=1822214 RepID=UPI0007C259DE|nr:PepSY domain-containing protein [Halioglobus sp. HI00S01]KZX58761.1 hypothetical protein A3709_17335 [Halioglobus sp. HI00S01]
MKPARWHSLIGLLMSIPLLLWAFTGAVFLTKPGYEGAYEQLAPKLYPIEQALALPPGSQWEHFQLLRTILGYHLIARRGDQVSHLDPYTLQLIEPPTDEAIALLVKDATEQNRSRYGEIISVEDSVVTTDTGVVITLDWDRLSLRQQGNDSRWLNTLYKIHYLQWLGDATANKVFGVLGLTLLFGLTGLGLYSYARKGPS